jgi:hypothetical protein
MHHAATEQSAQPATDNSVAMLVVRYGLGALMVIGGVIMLIISPAGLGVDGFAMAVGGGLSVVLFNVLFRLSMTSENDRAEEQRARAYFDEHGEWPEEEPHTGRRWTLAPGVVTYEQEQAQLRARETTGHAA